MLLQRDEHPRDPLLILGERVPDPEPVCVQVCEHARRLLGRRVGVGVILRRLVLVHRRRRLLLLLLGCARHDRGALLAAHQVRHAVFLPRRFLRLRLRGRLPSRATRARIPGRRIPGRLSRRGRHRGRRRVRRLLLQLLLAEGPLAHRRFIRGLGGVPERAHQLAEVEEELGVAQHRLHLRPVGGVERAGHAEGEEHARPSLIRVRLEPRVHRGASCLGERFERRIVVRAVDQVRVERLFRGRVELIQVHVQHVGVGGVVGESWVPPVVLPAVVVRPFLIVRLPFCLRHSVDACAVREHLGFRPRLRASHRVGVGSEAGRLWLGLPMGVGRFAPYLSV
eukprot:1682530-Prymnesium_polylepis.2